jgi:hypothetical protein
LKTNGVVGQSGMTWDAVYPGTALNFTNGLPLEFGFRGNAALGASATTTSRGPILANYRVEIDGASVPPEPPLLSIEPGGDGNWQIVWDAPGFVLQGASDIAGPWLDFDPQPVSPLAIQPEGSSNGFYRLRFQP